MGQLKYSSICYTKYLPTHEFCIIMWGFCSDNKRLLWVFMVPCLVNWDLSVHKGSLINKELSFCLIKIKLQKWKWRSLSPAINTCWKIGRYECISYVCKMFYGWLFECPHASLMPVTLLCEWAKIYPRTSSTGMPLFMDSNFFFVVVVFGRYRKLHVFINCTTTLKLVAGNGWFLHENFSVCCLAAFRIFQ